MRPAFDFVAWWTRPSIVNSLAPGNRKQQDVPGRMKQALDLLAQNPEADVFTFMFPKPNAPRPNANPDTTHLFPGELSNKSPCVHQPARA